MPPTSEAVRKVPTGPARRGPMGAEPARITAGQPGIDRGPVMREGDVVRIDARGVYYKTLNEQVRREIEDGATTVVLDNVNGQRYLAAGLHGSGVRLVVNGVPGNDLATFMDGPNVIVNDNAQDAVGNTMNSGVVAVHGDAGDVLGYGMRGGRLYVRGNVGYRVGIHMKAYRDRMPALVIGGGARDFLGEYMAGGEIVLLGLEGSSDPCSSRPFAGSYIGTGMHGGAIYVRGTVEEHQLGKEVGVAEPTSNDLERLRDLVSDFCRVMKWSAEAALSVPFLKLVPSTHRPYGKLYAY